ncbi:MAG TPA: K(+)-transporting ATPase subunit F [Verrucomicrobiales bacterium]|nr:K(+)-transporting ATPase subunit F [Verrucomicrobiales bacterium]
MRPSSPPRRSTSASATSSEPSSAMETAITGFIALLLFVYLFVAMIRPEKF